MWNQRSGQHEGRLEYRTNGIKRAGKCLLCPLRQATDQKAGGSNPSGRTKATEIHWISVALLTAPPIGQNGAPGFCRGRRAYGTGKSNTYSHTGSFVSLVQFSMICPLFRRS